METFVIDTLGGANRNNVEGVDNAPEVVKGFTFRRGGGYIPLGGKNESWLGERDLSHILLEDGGNILYEEGAIVGSEWRPSPNFGSNDLIAYDEISLALFGGPQVWLNDRLDQITGDEFQNEGRLSLAPRSAILAPWRPFAGGYEGGAWYLDLDGDFRPSAGAGTVFFSENAGTGLPADTYQFVWVIESPTDAGLVVHAIGERSRTVSGEIESLDITMDDILKEGDVVRFYYRPESQDVESASYERFSVKVSDGVNPITATLQDIGSTFFSTDEVLVNFAPGRLEPHNGRMWGTAAPDQTFVSFLPDAALTLVDGYMLVSGGNLDDERQYGTVASAQMALRSAADYINLTIPMLKVKRLRRDIPTIVELFNIRKETTADHDIWGVLRWNPDSSVPKLQVFFAIDEITAYQLVDVDLTLLSMQLDTKQNSEIRARNLSINLEIVSVTNAGDGSLTSIWSYEASAGAPAFTQAGQVTYQESNMSAAAAWAAFTSPEITTLAIGRVPTQHVVPASTGLREVHISAIETGNAAGPTVYSLGQISDYEPVLSKMMWVSSGPNGEAWTTVTSGNMIARYTPTNADLKADPEWDPSTILVYSDVGSVNRGTAENFIRLSPASSTRITGLASTPAGLLVFMENETFLVRGDPAPGGNLNVQRFSGTMGNDVNVIPARLGSVVMPIYKGEVFAITLGGGDVDFGGNNVNISRPVWRPDDPFVQVVGENLRTHVVALTQAGRVYRYDVNAQAWLNDLFDEDDVQWLLAACICEMYGVRYNVNGYLEVVDSSLVDDPIVEWADLDMGDKNRMKLWRRIEVFTGDTGTTAPTLDYDIRGQTGKVTGLDQGRGRWVFTLPRGIVGPKADLTFNFLDATSDLAMEPPVVVHYAPRYRER